MNNNQQLWKIWQTTRNEAIFVTHEVLSKNNRYFQIRLFDFCIIFLLHFYPCLLYMLTISVILDCQFVFDTQKVNPVVKAFKMFNVAFGESTVSRTQVHFWYNWFKQSLEDVNNDAREGLAHSFVRLKWFGVSYILATSYGPNCEKPIMDFAP